MKDLSKFFISSAVGTFIYLYSQFTTTASSYSTLTERNSSKGSAANLPYPNEDRPAQPKQPAIISRRGVAIHKEEQDNSLTHPDFHRNGSGNLGLQDTPNGQQKYLNLQDRIVGEKGYSRKRF